jgi:hypothetical protein
MNKIVKGLSVSAVAVAAITCAVSPALAANDPTNIFGVRHAGEKTYVKNITAQPGEVVEAGVQVYNTTGQVVDMNGRINLDTKGILSIVPGSAELTTAAGSAKTTSNITEQHSWAIMNVYKEELNQGWAIMRFKVQVPTVDKLLCGTNSYHLNSQVTAYEQNGKIVSDTEYYDASITVTGKSCNAQTEPEKKPAEPEKTKPSKELPSTGPEDVVVPVIGAGALATATAYYVISRKNA